VSTLSTLIEHGHGSLSQNRKTERRNKRNANWGKEVVKLSLFAVDIILYLKDL
jgi:hypothetical protein